MNTLVKKNIFVKFRDFGDFSAAPITVQVLENDLVTFCNHAGHHPEKTTFNDGLDNERTSTVEVCDKCDAWSPDGEEWL